MTDLRERFDEYRQVEAPDLWDRIEEMAAATALQPPPIRRRRPLVVALTAFLSVLLVGFALYLLRADAEPLAPADEPAPPANGGPVSTAADLLDGWQAAEGIGRALREANDVVAFEDGFVLAGGAVWVSDDGVRWEWVRRLPLTDSHGYIEAITVGGPGLVAVGGDFGAAVSVSPDGRAWTRVVHGDYEAVDVMYDVAAGEDLIVAIGSGSEGAALWTSPDGATWTQLDDDAGVFHDAFVSSVTRFRSGFVAAGGVGTGSCAGLEASAAVWTSPDGLAWTRTLIATGMTLDDVAAWDEGLLAIGSAADTGCGPDYLQPKTRNDDLAGVWASPDGVAWERLSTPDFPAPVDAVWLRGAADVGAGVLVVGGTMRFGPGDVGEEWVPFASFSGDGATWTDVTSSFDRSAFPEAGWLSGVVATESRVFVNWYGGLWVWGAPPPVATGS